MCSRQSYRLSIPPSTEALRHSGWDSLLRTSSTVTLYFCVDDRRDRRPGTRQNVSEPRGIRSCGPAPPTPPPREVVTCGSWDTGAVLYTCNDSTSSGSGVDSGM